MSILRILILPFEHDVPNTTWLLIPRHATYGTNHEMHGAGETSLAPMRDKDQELAEMGDAKYCPVGCYWYN